MQNLAGKTDIRAKGHCGCPSPDDYGTTWYTSDGQQIWQASSQKDYETFKKGGAIGNMPEPVGVWPLDSRVLFADLGTAKTVILQRLQAEVQALRESLASAEAELAVVQAGDFKFEPLSMPE